MGETISTIFAAIVSAIVGSFVGSLITIAVFRSKLDSQAEALNRFISQRIEDRENDRRENDRNRQEFRDLCHQTNVARERELEFIRREVSDFRNYIAATDRRQRFIMDLVTAIARKQGINHRITDGLEFNGDDKNGR
jgi:hypothetical protein